MERVVFGVLGPVVAERDGVALALKGPRHRAVLARLIVARRRVVTVSRLVDDLWVDPPPGAVGAVQTFVAALRRALEPERPPRAQARLLVTEGPGYALRAEADAVDAWRFEAAVAGAVKLPPGEALASLERALGLWRGPAYAEYAPEDWARGERSRLAELRLQAVEQRAEALLTLGRAAEAVPDLDVHTAGHPWREDAWRLLALALYRTGRQADALAVLRGARATLADQLGLDPGPGLRRLETDILIQSPDLDHTTAPAVGTAAWDPRPRRPETHADIRPADQADATSGTPADPTVSPAPVPSPESEPGPSSLDRPDQADATPGTPADPTASPAPAPLPESAPRPPSLDRPDPAGPGDVAARLWARATAAYDRTVAAGARARLESTMGLMRSLAVTGGGGLEAAREHRMAAVVAAEETGDVELTARVIGAFDVPAIWTRADDPELSARLVAAAERTLAALPSGAAQDAARCRLLATIALEMRGTHAPRGPAAAREAEEIARRLDDPALLAFALNGTFMQSCTRAGLAPRRDAIGAELVALAARHGLVTFEVLGHLIRLQARAALGDFATADHHAAVADRLSVRHELPLVGVFTEWYGALRATASEIRTQSGPMSGPAASVAAYRAAAARLDGAGMPGLERGILPLALLCVRLGLPGGRSAEARGLPRVDSRDDWGPYRPWAEPLALLDAGARAEARTALRALPEPPRDLLYEALCCLEAAAALELDDRTALRRIHARLLPAAGELAGAGSGLVTLGPVEHWLRRIAAALGPAGGRADGDR